MIFYINRRFHYIGELTIINPHSNKELKQPKDDEYNMLILYKEPYTFDFVYRIQNPEIAQYNKPFSIEMSFLSIEFIKNNNVIEIGQVYKVRRTQNTFGTVKIIQEIKD